MAPEPAPEPQVPQSLPEPIRPMNGAWTAERLDDLNEGVRDGFRRVDAEFAKVDKRFEQVDKRLDQVDKRFEQVHTDIRALNQTITRVGVGMVIALIGVIVGV